MATEPETELEAVVSRFKESAHHADLDAPPRMLTHPPSGGPAFTSLHQGDELATVHRAWADLGAAERERGTEAGATGSIRARVRARVTSAATEAARAAGHADRALLGDVIRAVDLLARRVDEIAQRLVQLEHVVEEVVVVTSEDVTRIRAVLASMTPDQTPAATSRPTSDD